MFYKPMTTLAAFALTATAAYAETALPFALDWKFEGPAARQHLADLKGLAIEDAGEGHDGFAQFRITL